MNVTIDWIKSKDTFSDAELNQIIPLVGEGISESDLIWKVDRADWILWLVSHLNYANPRQLVKLACVAGRFHAQNEIELESVLNRAFDCVEAWAQCPLNDSKAKTINRDLENAWEPVFQAARAAGLANDTRNHAIARLTADFVEVVVSVAKDTAGTIKDQMDAARSRESARHVPFQEARWDAYWRDRAEKRYQDANNAADASHFAARSKTRNAEGAAQHIAWAIGAALAEWDQKKACDAIREEMRKPSFLALAK